MNAQQNTAWLAALAAASQDELARIVAIVKKEVSTARLDGRQIWTRNFLLIEDNNRYDADKNAYAASDDEEKLSNRLLAQLNKVINLPGIEVDIPKFELNQGKVLSITITVHLS